MSRAIQLTALALFLGSAAGARSTCPVTLVTGTGDSDGFTITFRNPGKLPIRRLEFDCKPVRGRADQGQSNHCTEANAYFLPGNEYTVRYTYPGGKPETVRVSLRMVSLGDGRALKPSHRDACRLLRISPPKIKR